MLHYLSSDAYYWHNDGILKVDNNMLQINQYDLGVKCQYTLSLV